MLADDTVLLTSRPDFNLQIKQTNIGLSAYNKWFKFNKLSLNIKKIIIINNY